uniref:Secreted protein n=1 Tax=Myotis myotis TaxID=51298 RepID=A0A7J7T645_MYOMY|nr:hypothetical protein mMyoMyo1_009132 [Myotis myotis]
MGFISVRGWKCSLTHQATVLLLTAASMGSPVGHRSKLSRNPTIPPSPMCVKYKSSKNTRPPGRPDLVREEGSASRSTWRGATASKWVPLGFRCFVACFGKGERPEGCYSRFASSVGVRVHTDRRDICGTAALSFAGHLGSLAPPPAQLLNPTSAPQTCDTLSEEASEATGQLPGAQHFFL